MKIKDNIIHTYYFRDLKIGDVFLFNDDYYLKISQNKAFDLYFNKSMKFYNKDIVILLNAELVIRS